MRNGSEENKYIYKEEKKKQKREGDLEGWERALCLKGILAITSFGKSE